jgi:hypothetical protein
MLPQCLKFAFALTFCFQVTTQNHRADNRAFFVEDLSAAADDDTGATYLDLLREVFPDAKEAGDRFVPARPVRLRNLERPREANAREGAFEFSTAQALWFVHGGEHHLALIVNARHEPAGGRGGGGGEFNVLAVFAPQSRPRLVDAVEIDFDRFVGFWDESPLLPVRQGEMAFWVRATHHNSSEGFHSYYLTELRAGRLRLALAEPFGLTDYKLCGSHTTETLKITRERGAFAGRRAFDLHVRTETKPTRDCEGEKPARRRVAVRNYRLRWDARRKSYLPARTDATRAGPRR